MKIVKSIENKLRHGYSRVNGERVSNLLEENRRFRDLAQNWERRFWEQNNIIDRVIRERDEWKELHFQKSREHLNAQADYSKTLAILVNHLKKAIFILNKLREEKELEPIKDPKILDSLTHETFFDFEKFAERVNLARKVLMEQTDKEQVKHQVLDGLPPSASA